MKKILHELQRRNVIKAAISYAVFSWLLIQIASILYPSLGWGQDAITNTLIVLTIGFPVWIVFAYVFEWTPKGFKKTDDVAEEVSVAKTTGKKMNGVIIAGLSFAVLLLVSDRIFNFTGAMDTSMDNDKSIAVLAFADMSPNKDQEYFSDGISEEILNLLAKIPDLKVISRTSSFAFKGKEENIKQIGTELNVGHVLEGSIRKSGNTFRITAQLINVSDGTHVWSETYDRNMNDIFKIQDEIAAVVTGQLKVTLLGELPQTKTVDTEAYNLYLQAKQLKKQGTAEGTKNAENLIRQSIALDSTYAPAWEYLSEIIFEKIYSFVMLPMTQESITMGLEAAKMAIALDPDYALGYTALASFERANWDFTAASENINKALALEPENASVIGQAATNALYVGKPEETLRLQLKAMELDPLNYYTHYNLGFYYWILKDYNNAEKYMQTFLLHFPSASVAHSHMALIYMGQGDNEKALEELDKESDPFWGLYRKCMVVYAMGNRQEADSLLTKFIEDVGDFGMPNFAHVYALRGEIDAVFKWLDLAYENRDGITLEILNFPEMENLWGDPRWNAFLNKLGLPKDHGFHLD